MQQHYPTYFEQFFRVFPADVLEPEEFILFQLLAENITRIPILAYYVIPVSWRNDFRDPWAAPGSVRGPHLSFSKPSPLQLKANIVFNNW